MLSPSRFFAPLLTSLRGRLIVVTILGLGATAFAVVALTYLARTSGEQRTVRARDRVESELERLAEVAPSLTYAQRARRGRHGASELHSGFAGDHTALENAWLATIVARAEATNHTVIEQSTTPEGMPILGGAAPLEGGGYAWAAQRVLIGPEMSSFRLTVVALALAMFVMVFASVQTLLVFDRGATALRESVVHLGKDLRAKLARPRLRELAEVADGLDSLARDLGRAEEDKVRLLRELAEHERWAALGRVVAGVAHEVRNPLAAIKLRTDLAEGDATLSSVIREDFALIGSEVARLDRLVRDLLLLADKNAEARPRSLVDLAALGARRAELLAPWALEKGVHVEPSGHASAVVDVDAVTRAVDNLLRNAVEASPAGGTVTLAVDEDATSIRVLVRDQGSGVTAENADLLFEPFFTTKPTGTGLGLSLSRAVAETHRGTLQHARRDGWTEFTLRLPKE